MVSYLLIERWHSCGQCCLEWMFFLLSSGLFLLWWLVAVLLASPWQPHQQSVKCDYLFSSLNTSTTCPAHSNTSVFICACVFLYFCVSPCPWMSKHSKTLMSAAQAMTAIIYILLLIILFGRNSYMVEIFRNNLQQLQLLLSSDKCLNIIVNRISLTFRAQV